MLQWLLEKLRALGAATASHTSPRARKLRADVASLTTHEAVHGVGAKWDAARHARHGHGYGSPSTDACLSALTLPGKVSLYHLATQRPAGEALRSELAAAFGDGWRAACFGRATHVLVHSWGMPFAGLVEAIADVPGGSYVWTDREPPTAARCLNSALLPAPPPPTYVLPALLPLMRPASAPLA